MGDFLSPMIAQLLVYNSREGDISSTYPIPVHSSFILILLHSMQNIF